MQIRPATSEDFAGLCRLWAAVDGLHAELCPEFFRAPPDPPRSRGDLRRQLAESDRLTLVADEQGEPIGLAEARLCDTPDQPQLQPRRRVYLDELVVAARWQHRGVGRALLEAVEVWGRQRGATDLLLTVWTGNRSAEEFYGELGFRPQSQVLGRRL
jgi:ribosomal protein S18 acetylase RimI-like enzyme